MHPINERNWGLGEVGDCRTESGPSPVECRAMLKYIQWEMHSFAERLKVSEMYCRSISLESAAELMNEARMRAASYISTCEKEPCLEDILGNIFNWPEYMRSTNVQNIGS